MPEAFRLTPDQQRLVEDNMGLVHKVIKEYILAPDRLGIFSRDDLFQIGCEGLCKAAARFKAAGTAEFSTYACIVIRNQLYDAMRYSTVRTSKETLTEQPLLELQSAVDPIEPGDSYDIYAVLERATSSAGEPIQKGARALVMRLDGYNTKEIGTALGAAPGTVRMWISRTRRYLAENPEICMLAEAG